MEQRGLHPRKRLGQNFLKDRGILRLVVKEADLRPDDLVLEVGSGPGALTEELAASRARVLAVEIDESLGDVARQLLGAPSNVTWLQADILERKNRLNPLVLDRLRVLLAERQSSSLKIVANLPYNVATPVLVNIIESDLPWSLMVVTVQAEVAGRLVAAPGSRSYGLVSVLISLKAATRLVRRIGPDSFWPKPLVQSSIVRIERRTESPLEDKTYSRFKMFAQGLFAQRRKGWLKSLLSHLRIEEKALYRQKFIDQGLEIDRRAETLSPQEIVLLFEKAMEFDLLKMK